MRRMRSPNCDNLCFNVIRCDDSIYELYVSPPPPKKKSDRGWLYFSWHEYLVPPIVFLIEKNGH